MSWLISLFLAGAMFASAGDNTLRNIEFNDGNADAKRGAQAEETERFEQVYPLDATGKVSVSNVNGSITVDVWDNPQVRLEYVKTAERRENLSRVDINIDSRQEAFSLKTDYERYAVYDEQKRTKYVNAGKLRIDYHLTVPRGAFLDQIATVNGSVDIKDAANSTKASTVNGTLNATNLRGALVSLSTVSGTINADFDALQAGSRISLSAVNGRLNLTVPSDADATILASTINGNIANDFNLPVRKSGFVGRNLYGKLGGGDVKIKLTSVNGALSVKRRNDGKAPKATTNLSPNFEDENDWDDADENDDSPRVKPPHPPKPPRAPSAPNVEIDDEMIRKSVEKGLKEAQREIERIKPDLEKINRDALKQAADAVNSPEVRAQLKAARENYKAILANADWTNAAALNVEEKSESFTVKGTPRVSVEAENAQISVRGWDKSEVRYSATRVSKNDAPLDLTATQNGSNVNIKIADEGENNREKDYFSGQSNRVRVEIFVPRKSDLKIKTGGAIRLENVSGALDLQGADESINVRDADGRLSVGTGDGAIRVIGFRGAFDGRTGDGTMNLEGVFDSFNALAADGAIVLILPENADAVLEANAEIESDGVNLTRPNAREKIWRAGRGSTVYRMSVKDGRIVVRGANALKTSF